MSTTTEKVRIEALSLPRDARAEIARLLIRLGGEDFPDEVSETWRDEIERRRQDFPEDRANPVPADEALRRAYAAMERSRWFCIAKPTWN